MMPLRTLDFYKSESLVEVCQRLLGHYLYLFFYGGNGSFDFGNCGFSTISVVTYFCPNPS